MFRRLTLHTFSGRTHERESCVFISSFIRPKEGNARFYYNTSLIMKINHNNITAMYPHVLSKE
jgi:hypothetical protein